VLVTIKEKRFLQYLSPMKSDVNTRNPNKLCRSHYDHSHNIKEGHTLKKKKDKNNDHQKLHSLVHEKNKHDMREVYTHDNLPEII
jgi:recombination DNA repair RAD52 pathway protein